eukprot:CAMPEP_0171994774 /NCGR_PEP_ID=MMETSP0993-20121228/279129_1 /TAXON_ID=483369 /ORGANISM="non described non described, Strain CCMP2098" /LENGTH=492 /DNA_ID=CAMNT_0012647861 /DNA_START=58 /DNA_END=1536 /DNA_ORIENTATION=-
MNDAQIAMVYPSWATSSKAKREKIFRQYQDDMIGGGGSLPEKTMKELEARDEKFSREMFLERVPLLVANGDYLSLFGLIQDEWQDQVGGSLQIEAWAMGLGDLEGTQLALDLWDRAGPALLNALTTRDGMMALNLVLILEPVSLRCGRAATALQKATSFCGFISFVLGPSAEGTALAAPPLKQQAVKLLCKLLWRPSPSFIKRLAAEGVVDLLANAVLHDCSSLIDATCDALQLLVRSWASAAGDPDLSALLKPSLERAASAVNERILATNVQCETIPAAGGTDVDIGKVLGGLATTAQQFSTRLSLPVPLKVRRHLAPFGAKYSPSEPREPLERERWSNRFVCMRVAELDWSAPANAALAKTLTGFVDGTWAAFHARRLATVQCASCHKPEKEVAGDGEEGGGDGGGGGGGAGRMKKCSRCKLARYCSAECQKNHWPKHKLVCVKVSKTALPKRMLTLTESMETVHKLATAGGSTQYPTLFVTWLDWKFKS